jgi:hypothetical protein
LEVGVAPGNSECEFAGSNGADARQYSLFHCYCAINAGVFLAAIAYNSVPPGVVAGRLKKTLKKYINIKYL